MSGFDLIQTRFHEETGGDAAISEQIDDLLDPVAVIGDIEATFGGQFLSSFRDQGDEVRFYAQGDLRHRVVGGHFQVQFGSNDFPQHGEIAVLNMPAVFPQMHHQPIGAGQFDENRGGQGIRIGAAARLPQCRHMIDIDTQSSHHASAVCMNDA